MNLLKQPAPPSLPSASTNYERAYHDQFNNILRLYFNQISNNLTAVFGDSGGRYIDCPNALFFNTADQTFAAINTAYPVVFNATYLNNAVRLQAGSTSKVEVSIGGVYNFQYSGQVKTSSAGDKNLYLWVARNGTNIGYSTHAWTFHDNNHYAEISWNFNIDLDIGEYIELQIASDSTAIRLDAEAATSPHSGIPSGVLAVNFIAPLPDPRPTPP